MSAIELYCDRVRDLINPDKDNLQVCRHLNSTSINGSEQINIFGELMWHQNIGIYSYRRLSRTEREDPA